MKSKIIALVHRQGSSGHEYLLKTTRMSKKIVLLFILISSYAFSQSVNNYQYVIVPVKFDFFKKDDQYGLNTLTKLLLQKYGFKAYLATDKIPSEIENQRCDFLYADVIENNGMMMTKLKLTLKDCKGKLLFETQVGGSREKEYAISYNQALREAGKSFDKLNYKFNGNSGGKHEEVAVKTEATIPKKPIEATDISNLYIEPLFAKPFGENGFQLLTNNTDVPTFVMTIYKTSSPDCYLVNNGVLLRKSGKWFLEYYKEDKLVSELLTVVNLN
ncbi:hypothetical protein QWY90_04045 [Flavobacterium paronense]|uniref:Uncharacterized protein n=1 Tax=Flavobacterium paronense TaxID=1392775 RepID=A0ABV5GHK1_9FLAO|nr:hypothetical protein [Flavobacterium paronense]MDN3676477.1 hypothetical protein [Flavobacterium paronense]